MPTTDQHRPSRRTVVRGVAWSAPVVSTVAAAPAFAASPCQRTALQPVTWTAGTTTSLTGAASGGAGVSVSASYTTGLGGGRIHTPNLSVQSVASTNDAFLLANVAPTLLADASFQTVTFTFARPVHELTFAVDDVDAENGCLDCVALAATPAETPASAPGSAITGAGTVANPWRTTGGAGDNAPTQTVGVTYADGLAGVTSLQVRYWSSTVIGLGTGRQQVRVRQMRFRTCV